MRALILLRRGAELESDANSTSAWRRGNIRMLIGLRRGAELAFGRRFHFNVARSSHPNADSTSSWRRADIQTRIPLGRGAQLECGR